MAYRGAQVLSFQLVNKLVSTWDHRKLFSFSFAGQLKAAATMPELGALERCSLCSSVAYGLGVKFILNKMKNQNGFVTFWVLAETSGLGLAVRVVFALLCCM